MKNEELLQIIEQAAREKATVLNLDNNQFSSLPPEISQLSNLISLNLQISHLFMNYELRITNYFKTVLTVLTGYYQSQKLTSVFVKFLQLDLSY
ncbi:hypothetical protein [uncultured Nostoc sp.]|uniref:hypothetical protein n=1 Tax=Nostoc sp. TaxID=1180 RepID=UPI0035CBA2E8|nr:hypothetical protein [Nostoc sp. JL33]